MAVRREIREKGAWRQQGVVRSPVLCSRAWRPVLEWEQRGEDEAEAGAQSMKEAASVWGEESRTLPGLRLRWLRGRHSSEALKL